MLEEICSSLGDGIGRATEFLWIVGDCSRGRRHKARRPHKARSPFGPALCGPALRAVRTHKARRHCVPALCGPRILMTSLILKDVIEFFILHGGHRRRERRCVLRFRLVRDPPFFLHWIGAICCRQRLPFPSAFSDFCSSAKAEPFPGLR